MSETKNLQADVEILETATRTFTEYDGTVKTYTDVVAVRTRFGTFRVGDVIKAAKGETVTIRGFWTDGSRTHVIGKANMAWRSTMKNRHA